MIVYNGKDLSDFGMACVGQGAFSAPARDIEQVHIPGRNGDLLFDNGGFMNVNLTYPKCSIVENFPENSAALRNFLLSAPGYHRLEDSYNPDEYRMAEFRGPFDAEGHTGRGNRSGVFDLTFNCQPQRFLKSGEDYILLPPQRHTDSLYRVWLNFPADTKRQIRYVKIITAAGATVTINDGDGEAEYEADESGAVELTYTSSSGQYATISVSSTSRIKRIDGDNLGVVYKDTAASRVPIIMTNPAPYAQPILCVRPAANDEIIVYHKRVGEIAIQHLMITEPDGETQMVYTVDPRKGYVVKARPSSSVKYNGSPDVSGEMPGLLQGNTEIDINNSANDGDVSALSVYLYPNWWGV